MIQANNQQYRIYKYQVSGKAAKFITSDGKQLLKGLTPNQLFFYEALKSRYPLHSINKFTPCFHGVIELQSQPDLQDDYEKSETKQIGEWLNHLKSRYPVKDSSNKFIKLSNLLYGYQLPNILDIKVGNRNQKPQKITQSVAKYFIKLNGIQKNSKNCQQQFRSKYGLNKIHEEQQILENIAWYFQIDGQIQVKLLTDIINQLKQLVLSIRSFHQWTFVSSSICLFYDAANTHKYHVSFIDFGRACEDSKIEYDSDTSFGIQNIISLMNKVLERHSYFNMKTPRKDSTNIPEKKIKKFEELSKKLNGENI